MIMMIVNPFFLRSRQRRGSKYLADSDWPSKIAFFDHPEGNRDHFRFCHGSASIMSTLTYLFLLVVSLVQADDGSLATVLVQSGFTGVLLTYRRADGWMHPSDCVMYKKCASWTSPSENSGSTLYV